MRNTPVEESRFREFIDRLVLKAADGGITIFDQILLSLLGVYPSTALDSLQRLVSRGKIPKKILSNAIKITSTRQCKEEIHGEPSKCLSLPVPHPLDYDWRFGDRAVDHLLGKCLELTTPTDTVILLGTPSVLAKAIEQNYPRKIILFEENRAVAEFLIGIAPKGSIFKCDLTGDTLPQLSSKAVICDSPWYVEYVTSFLWSACQLCTINGYLLLSTPPIGTRPNVNQEWAKTLEWANRLDFTLIKIEHGVLPYKCPPFERNALRAESLNNIPEEWRCSNLALFIREHEAKVPRPPPCSTDGNWTEEIFQGVRIRFRCRQHIAGFENPTLKTIVSGDILPSVSRWDERRKLADFWTSGNRIFNCQGPGLLQLILRALASGLSPENTIAVSIGRRLSQVESNLVMKASEQITTVIKVEKYEYMYYQEEE